MAPQEITTNDFTPLITDVATAAKRLLGCILEREIDGQVLRVKIVETEAYDQTDLASHSFKGPTSRAKTMFGPAGYSYVYFTYGMHYCCNIVVGEAGYGAGVLVRAVEPLDGTDSMSTNRGGKTGPVVCNGPGKLCQALQIDRSLDGHSLREAPLRLRMQPPVPEHDIVTTTRIGISQAKDTLWRFYIRDNAYVSVKAKAAC